MRSRLAGAARRAAGIAFVGLFLAGCAGTGGPAASPAGTASADGRREAYARLVSRLQPFEVSGGVRTDRGDILPEVIDIEIRNEVCVESRAPGARFWSLDYDTCFVWAARDSVGPDGSYAVSVPCLDADATYESQEKFGELRLVQRGPITFLAESDAGWKMQDTFASSRSQRRDLVLDLRTDKFWVVAPEADLRARPSATARSLVHSRYGDAVEVVRFHQGWAECLTNGKIGWMEMSVLGTQEEMKEAAPPAGQPPPADPPRGSGASP